MTKIKEHCTRCDETTLHTVVTDTQDYDLDIVTCTKCNLQHKHSLYINCGY